MNKKIFIFSALVIILILIFISLLNKPERTMGSNLEFNMVENEQYFGEFTKATEIREFTFPIDHGAHPEYLTEWWYYTGNVLTKDGRHFGYQLTFFRRAISGEYDTNRQSDWSTNQIYLAHFAITDTKNNIHFVDDQISRGSAGLAGTKTDPLFSIWLRDWEIIQLEEDQFQLKAKTDSTEIDLLLTNQKGMVFHGNDGLSQKGREPGNASYYFSQTRLETQGKIRIQEEEFVVSGYSWMDHEFGTSTLGENQIGWDWFSVQLDNDTEIMLFQIREEDGSTSAFSSGTLINKDSSTKNLTATDFEIMVEKTWKNSNQVEYPNRWNVSIPDLGVELDIIPVIDDQEMDLFFTYWEGAVKVSGVMNGEMVSGFGYVELTGYAQSMKGIF
jgi:predicted secreted hydrolase